MKKINFVKGAAAISVLSLGVFGLMAANTASAATSNTATAGTGFKLLRGHKIELTTAQIADRTAKMTAIKTALDSGDYNAWVAAVKAVHSDSPILTVITSDKFSKYVEAIKLREQADTIMKDLGVKGSQGMHLED